MKCPKCRQDEMIEERYGQVMVRRCPLCEGLFFSDGDLTRMLEEQHIGTGDRFILSATEPERDHTVARCYECESDMTASEGPAKVRIDHCTACGAVFLDKGELAKLQLHNW